MNLHHGICSGLGSVADRRLHTTGKKRVRLTLIYSNEVISQIMTRKVLHNREWNEKENGVKNKIK